jgi:hypothetical protein
VELIPTREVADNDCSATTENAEKKKLREWSKECQRFEGRKRM